MRSVDIYQFLGFTLNSPQTKIFDLNSANKKRIVLKFIVKIYNLSVFVYNILRNSTLLCDKSNLTLTIKCSKMS